MASLTAATVAVIDGVISVCTAAWITYQHRLTERERRARWLRDSARFRAKQRWSRIADQRARQAAGCD